MIELKDFIKETLHQITDACAEFADERGIESGVSTIPNIASGSGETAKLGILKTGSKLPILTIAFDVAVTADQNNASEAGGGFKLAAIFEAGGKISDASNSSNHTRVNFTLPLRLGKEEAPAPTLRFHAPKVIRSN